MDVSCIHRCKGSCHLLSSPINICAQRIELNPTTNCLQFPNTKMEWTVRPFAVSQQQQLQQINNSVNECIHHSNSIVTYTNLHFVDTYCRSSRQQKWCWTLSGTIIATHGSSSSSGESCGRHRHDDEELRKCFNTKLLRQIFCCISLISAAKEGITE